MRDDVGGGVCKLGAECANCEEDRGRGTLLFLSCTLHDGVKAQRMAKVSWSCGWGNTQHQAADVDAGIDWIDKYLEEAFGKSWASEFVLEVRQPIGRHNSNPSIVWSNCLEKGVPGFTATLHRHSHEGAREQ